MNKPSSDEMVMVPREQIENLISAALYTDSYGVPGSDFPACRVCDSSNQPGLLAKADWHPSTCIVKQFEDMLAGQTQGKGS